MPTLSDVARTAGTSKATASRVLSGRSAVPISAATTARVLEAARLLDYAPNQVASALATGKTGVVALWMRILHRPFYAELIHQMAKQAGDAGYDLIVEQARPVCEQPGAPWRRSGWPVDGIIAHEPPGGDAARWRDAPVVGVSERAFGGRDVVWYDLYAGTRAAMEHLIGGGARKIAYVGSGETLMPGRRRHDAYQDLLAEAGLQPVQCAAEGETEAHACEAVAALLADEPDVDGLFCHNDSLASGALRALREAGRRVPGDVAVVGCDGTDSSGYTEPPLSTIAIPLADIVGIAWGLLYERMADPDLPPRLREVSPHLVVRRSSQR